MDREDALSALVSLPEVARIEVARLTPTDVLVVECELRLTEQSAANIQTLLKRIWPDHRVVVLMPGARLRVVSGPVDVDA